ncbi:MAG: D-2-hydroxyacid dehydrogenase family protein [Pseudomonadota bacterium]|nr:D-2-hydroxyacid dehydrogenase family protein [Pseudomonadota bacterium]
MRVGVLDDWQDVARRSADWSALEAVSAITIFPDAFASEDAAAAALAEFDVLILMRERTPFPGSLIERLPKLRMIALTGARSPSLDTAACTAAGIVISTTGGTVSSVGTAELTLGLMIAAARRIPAGDAAIRAGRFQDGVEVGPALVGKTLGIIGLGKIGSRMARYAVALEMNAIAWSRNLDEASARAGGAMLAATKEALLREADVVTLHVPLSAGSRGLIGAAEIGLMKPGALLVNTSRAGLIDGAALLEALHAGRIMAALDVYEEEPLPVNDPIRTAPNTVLSPHLGYGTTDTFRQFYKESIENILAFHSGSPIRVMNPNAIKA